MGEPGHGRSALATGYRVGRHGQGRPQVTLAERRGLAKVHLAANPDDTAFAAAVETAVGLRPPLAPNTTTTKDGVTLLWLAPDRWLVVASGQAPGQLAAWLASALAGTSAAVTDVSHGRTVIRLSGPKAREILAKGCPLDLHPRSFKRGDCAQSSLTRINVLLHAAADTPTIDLYVARSYALALWEWLTESAGEFGYEVSGPEMT